MDVGLNCQRLKCGQWTVISEYMRLLYEFSTGFTAERVTNWSWASKLGYYSHYASSCLRYLWDVWSIVICIILKALNGFLMIQKQMTLKVYNVWKLHRPRMSPGLLAVADNVNTALASLLYSCTTDAVFSEVLISEWTEKDVCSWRAVSLR